MSWNKEGAAVALIAIVTSCDSAPRKGYHQIAEHVNPSLTLLIEPTTRMMSAKTDDAEVVSICRRHVDLLRALQGARSDADLISVGRAADVGSAARDLIALTPACRDAVNPDVGVCAQLCLDLWINLAHEVERLSVHAHRHDVRIVKILGGS